MKKCGETTNQSAADDSPRGSPCDKSSTASAGAPTPASPDPSSSVPGNVNNAQPFAPSGRNMADDAQALSAPGLNGVQRGPETATPKPGAAPTIEREPIDCIHVGAGGRLVVPREDIVADVDLGDELNLVEMLNKKIQKPGRREWIALNLASELPTRLLIHKPKADGIEVEHYYIGSGLRGPIRDELKEVRVFVYYSFQTHTHAIWIINVTVDNSWYESLQALLSQPPSFFAEKAVKISSDKDNDRYRVRAKALPSLVTWPSKSTEELLGEALGMGRIINSADHPIYRDLVEGEDLK